MPVYFENAISLITNRLCDPLKSYARTAHRARLVSGTLLGGNDVTTKRVCRHIVRHQAKIDKVKIRI